MDAQATKPLQGLRLVDAGHGLSAAMSALMLHGLGASVVRLSSLPVDRDDAPHPALRAWRHGFTRVPIAGDVTTAIGEICDGADILLVGGDGELGLEPDLAAIREKFPALIITNIRDTSPDGSDTTIPSSELLAQARSGLAFEHFDDRPIVAGFRAASHGAAMQATAGTLAALIQREQDGAGRKVSTSLLAGATMWGTSYWYQMDHGDRMASFVLPKNPHNLIFRCRDGAYVHLALGTPGSKFRLLAALGLDTSNVSKDDRGLPNPALPPREVFGPIDLLQDAIGSWDLQPLLATLERAEISAEQVLPPGACWSDPQVLANGIIHSADDGTQHVGMPFVVKESLAISEAAAPSPSAAALPLSGIRVLDMGTLIAGPLASCVLADLGAEVIKVEPASGDPSRAVFRIFCSANRGKKSVVIDTKSGDGLAQLHQLARTADVIHGNFRAGVSKRLGIDALSLHKDQPDKIVLESFAYGAHGPRAAMPGYDMIFQAMCGLEHLAGGTGNAPLWNRAAVVDYAAGMLGSIAILAALFHRSRTGNGAAIDGSLLNAALFMLAEAVKLPDGTIAGTRQPDAEILGFHPLERFYESSDGWMALHAPSPESASALLRAVDLPDIDPADFGKPDAASTRKIASALKSMPLSEALARVRSAGAWAEPCLKDGSHRLRIANHQTTTDAAPYRWPHPQYGMVSQFGPLFVIEGLTPHTSPCPALGEHTEAIFSEVRKGVSSEVRKAIDETVAGH